MQENQIIKSTKDKKAKNSILSPKLDVVFQILFGEVGSEEITKDLLSSILDEQINTVALNQNILLRRRTPNDKMGIVDVLAKINDNEYCNIEMQLSADKDIIKRILYYWSKQYSTDDLELHIIELPKMRNTTSGGKDKKLVEWLHFLENPESKEVTSYMKNNESMKKAKEKLNTMSEDETIRRLAELREKAILDELEVKAYSYKKGKNDGIEQNNKEIAKKMKEENIDLSIILKITGLTKEEIEKL